MSPLTQDELLAQLGQAVHRNLPGVGKTTADGLYAFLATLVQELVARSEAGGFGGSPDDPDHPDGAVLTAPNGLTYRLAVTNEGQVRTTPADGLPLAEAAAVLTAPNGLTYRLSVADDGGLQAVPAPAGTDPDAAAFVAAAGLVNVAQQVAVGELVRALKVSNVWQRLHALYPMVGGTARAHALNLKDPRDADTAFRLTFYQSPRHSALGVSWDGSSQYADTHFVPAGRLALDSCHLAYYATTTAPARGQADVDLGCREGNNSLSLLCRFNGDALQLEAPSGGCYTHVPTPLGFSLGSRLDGGTQALYRDGQAQAILGGNSPGTPYPHVPLLLAHRQDGYYSTRSCGLASVGDGLTPDEAHAYSAAVQTFERALGRDVAFEPEALAFSQAAGLGDPGQTQAVSTLVRALKDGGVWPQLRAVYPMVGGTERAHALNLKDPRDADTAFRLTFYHAPQHSALGVAWDGSSQYASTHLVPRAHLAPTDNHLAYFATTDGSPEAIEIELGALGDGSLSLLLRHPGHNNGMYAEDCGSPQYTVPLAHGLGLGLLSRTSLEAIALYRDGRSLPLLGFTNGNVDSTTAPLLLGARQDGYFSRKACGFASIGGGLTTAQAGAYAAAVRAFQQALGRDVTLAPDVLLG